jgi:hypothetical protein
MTDQTLNTMLDVARIGLGAATLLSGAPGGVVAGQLIGPTEAALASRKLFEPFTRGERTSTVDGEVQVLFDRESVKVR